MDRDNKLYNVYKFENVAPGKSLKVEHTLYPNNKTADISDLVLLPLTELENRRAKSAENEKAILTQITEEAGWWDEQAALTRLLDKAIEYVKAPALSHTANMWAGDSDNYHCRSNAVYKMTYHVYEKTVYNRDTRKQETAAWDLTWGVFSQSPGDIAGAKIAGQDRKKFTDKAAMEKYLTGRIAAYDSLFTEISPPVPPEYAKHFKVNGVLLPGYTVKADEAAGAVSRA